MSIDQQEQANEALPEEDPASEPEAVAALSKIFADNPVMLLDVLIDVFRLARDTAQKPKGKFHTIIVPDVGVLATITTVDSFEEFLAVWQEAWQQQAAQIFGFSPNGDRILPSTGGDYMVTPWGRFPLYTKSSNTDVDPMGRLGPVPAIPKAAPVTAAPSDDGDDEMTGQEEDTNDDGVLDDDDEDDEE